jgi:hypothetical protein
MMTTSYPGPRLTGSGQEIAFEKAAKAFAHGCALC